MVVLLRFYVACFDVISMLYMFVKIILSLVATFLEGAAQSVYRMVSL